MGGEVNFHPAYNGNILVNAMTVGIADKNRIFYARPRGVGNPVVYVGAKTGRDGIHGATMASAEFSEDREEKRPTVQVGDPFTEKLLLEACLELMATDAIVAIQDMGAAGLTSSSFEMAAKGGLGIELELDNVPMRETGMTPYEIMLSESQERMLMVIKPEARDRPARNLREMGARFRRDRPADRHRAHGADAWTAHRRRHAGGRRWSTRRRSMSARGRRRRRRLVPASNPCRRTDPRSSADADGQPRSREPALDLGAVRSSRHGPDGDARQAATPPWCASDRGAQGAGADHRLHAALLPGRSRDRRRAGRGREPGAT